MHSAREIASAEAELAIRGGSEEVAFERKLQRSGRASAIVGALFIVWSLGMTAMFISMRGAPIPVDPAAPFVARLFDRIFIFVGVLQTVAGVLLLVGGLGMKRHRPLGPRLIAGAISLGLFYVLAFLVLFMLSFTSAGQPLAMTLFSGGLSVVVIGIWAFLLWLPLRLFLSPRVTEACARTTSH